LAFATASLPRSASASSQIGLDHLPVALQREDQGDVDRLTPRDRVLDRAETRLRCRDLHEQVRPVDPLVQAHRLVEGCLTLVRERRVDLHRDVAVLALAVVPDPAEQIAGVLNIGHCELEEDLFGVRRSFEAGAQLVVVGIALGDRLLEDRRVRRHADDRVLAHHPLEAPLMDELS